MVAESFAIRPELRPAGLSCSQAARTRRAVPVTGLPTTRAAGHAGAGPACPKRRGDEPEDLDVQVMEPGRAMRHREVPKSAGAKPKTPIGRRGVSLIHSADYRYGANASPVRRFAL